MDNVRVFLACGPHHGGGEKKGSPVTAEGSSWFGKHALDSADTIHSQEPVPDLSDSRDHT